MRNSMNHYTRKLVPRGRLSQATGEANVNHDISTANMTTPRPRGWPLVGLLCVAAAGGCRPASHDDGRPLTLVLSGDTAGWLVPCGCTSNQSGGLLRRGSYVRQLRGQGHVLVADVGGAHGRPLALRSAEIRGHSGRRAGDGRRGP